jgi:HEPN domain-containing protein
MANPRRVEALLEMADEDLSGAKVLSAISTRLARYHVQQGAEKAVKALLEHRGLNPGREHRFESLAEMLPQGDQWRGRIQSLDTLSPAATSHRYPTAEGRIMSPPARSLVEQEIVTVTAFIQDVRRAVSEPSG